jgi:hypothetical protein
MDSLLRIEVPDQKHAETLRRCLQPDGVETVAVEGHCEVRVDLLDLNPDNRIVAALNAVEQWLQSAGLAFVRVHLNEHSYTLHGTAMHSAALDAPPF